jgi:UTP--glucose-1-phosphate uridylyltransferase
MGLTGPKSLLTVKRGLTFLDILLRQARAHDIPLVLMNSFSTRDATANAIASQTVLPPERVIMFEQDLVPKIAKADLTPGRWPADERLEWCPPGHGNVYSALDTSGTLDRLLADGYEYAFVSNIDNLGAVIDFPVLGWFAEQALDFMLEVTDRTEADKKGGHLARRADGKLILRETAQCRPEDVDAFQDTGRHRFFNTNNLWLSLPALKAFLGAVDGVVRLPMIRNTKTIDPRDRNSPAVYQLETAMGAAVELFDDAAAVRVPRVRFAPVKNTGDLLAVRSDAYELTDDFRVVPSTARTLGPLVVTLDPPYYGFVDQMEARFPHGAPSLVACELLGVVGDVKFGRDVVVRGTVQLANRGDVQREIPDGTVLEGGPPPGW